MTKKQTKSGTRSKLWCCFGGSNDHPDIQIDTTITERLMTPPKVEATMQMPPITEWQSKFEELVDELDLPAKRREDMLKLDPEKQWQIYCGKKQEQQDPNKTATSWPDYYIDRLNAMSTTMVLLFDEEEIASRLKLVDSLKSALRTQSIRFVVRFIELDGLSCILNFLSSMVPEVRESRIHTSVIGCVKALMNNTQGRGNVLAHPEAIKVIAQSLRCESIRTKIAVLEILGAVCLVPGGHKKVLEAMLHFQLYAHERTRFQSIISELSVSYHHSPDDDSFEVNLKTAIMSFLNALINCGAGEGHLEFRCHLRYELLLLGIQPVLEELRAYENDLLDKHISFFELIRREDEDELASRYDVLHVDTKSAGEMFEFIQKKLSYTEAYPHLLSLLQHIMLLPLNRGGCPHHWQLFDRIVQQITLQRLDGSDPDVTFLRDFHLERCLKLLVDENEIKKWKESAETMRTKHDELRAQLERKERECEAKGQEKEELMKTLNILKGKLDSATQENLGAAQKLTEMAAHADVLRETILNEQKEKAQLQEVIKSGSVSDDVKSLLLSSSAPPPPPPVAAPPPPPPPPSGGAPPPPPPPGGVPPPPGAPPPPGVPAPGLLLPKKSTPKPSNPLKSFNWSKLPESKISGTIWADLDDAKAYKLIDLPDFDNTFSAYQRQQELGNGYALVIKYEKTAGNTYRSLMKYAKTAGAPSLPIKSNEDNSVSSANKKYGSQEDLSSKKVKELSLIDGKRAQNCTILLSKIKLTDQEIKNAVLSCDQGEDLPKDMLEQMLKYIPTKEEADMFNEHKSDVQKLAKADRFLFEMSKIEHYEQRLQAVFYKKKFHERISELRPKVEALSKASKEIQTSKKLRKVLEMILAFGNYMNKGQRGNAYGFKLASLSKISDTKSSLNRNVTLMHFLIGMLEKNSPDVINLASDLASVKEAARVSLGEVEKEMGDLRVGLKNLKGELEFQKNSQSTNQAERKDKFIPVMTDFVTIATLGFSELEDALTTSKKKFDSLVRMFGEDPVRMQPDAFFGLFTDFLDAFATARKDNIAMRQKKVEEEKRRKKEEEAEKKKKKSGGKGLKKGDNNPRGEFDDLVSALRSGEVFEKDGNKFQKRNRGRNRAGPLDMDRERVVSKLTTNI